MKQSRHLRPALATLLLLAAATGVQSASPKLIVEATFESGALLDNWLKVRTNVPVVTTEQARAGKYSMKSTLGAADALALVKGGERNEMQAKNSKAQMDESTWYGFSVFLPADYAPDSIWEIVAQWYPTADVDEEWSRQPTLALSTTGGKWSLSNKWSTEVVSPFGHASIKQKTWGFDQKLNKWTDWVINVRWTHKSDGFLKVWQDGKLVVDHVGPTSYNDQVAPFVKMGIYKGWAKLGVDRVNTRTVYHDEFRMAGPDGSYAAVAPAGSAITAQVPVPKPPSGIVIQ